MISAGDFRNGITVEMEGNVYQIIEFQHVKPGKGAAFVRTKLKNIKSGGVIEKSFRPTEKFPQARIDRKDMQYLYSDGDLFYFMDVENYEQIGLCVAEKLISRLETGSVPAESCRIPTSVILRESTGRMPASGKECAGNFDAGSAGGDPSFECGIAPVVIRGDQ